MDIQLRTALDRYLESHLQSTVFEMDLSIDYLNRDISAHAATLDDFYDSVTDKDSPSLATSLEALIEGFGSSSDQVCSRSGISIQVLEKILNMPDYTPTKSTLIALGIALELTPTSMETLLSAADYTFSDTIKRDLIFRFFLEKRIYDRGKINTYLIYYKELPLR